MGRKESKWTTVRSIKIQGKSKQLHWLSLYASGKLEHNMHSMAWHNMIFFMLSRALGYSLLWLTMVHDLAVDFLVSHVCRCVLARWFMRNFSDRWYKLMLLKELLLPSRSHRSRRDYAFYRCPLLVSWSAIHASLTWLAHCGMSLPVSCRVLWTSIPESRASANGFCCIPKHSIHGRHSWELAAEAT